jgi:glycosyltransferase involved in cell wall biosynthesis
MKIAQIISALNCGGAERQLLWLCEGLRRHGCDVVVASVKPGGPMTRAFLDRAFAVQEFGLRGAVDARVYYGIRAWLKKEAPDIVHTHLFKADVYGGLAAQSLKIPVISSKRNEDQYLRNPLAAWLARRVAGRCARVVAISEAVHAFLLREAHFKESWLEVIRIGIPLTTNTIVDRSDSTILRFGVAARLEEQKGHSLLLKALSAARPKLPPFRLSIYGEGSLENELKEQAAALQLQEQVRFCGFTLSREEIFSEVDVLLLPSLWEGAGTVLLEGMMHGIPIIASRAGGIPEYVSEDCGLLFPSGDADALAEALLKMASDSGMRKQFSEKCRERVKLFNFENTLASHLRLYKQTTEK